MGWALLLLLLLVAVAVAVGGSWVPGMSKKEAQIQWVTVALNEAAIDSPSFRAYVNHYHTKVTRLEDWVQSYGQTVNSKYVETAKEFRAIKRGLLGSLLPPPDLLGGGLTANQTYAPLIVHRFNGDYEAFIKKVSSVVFMRDGTYSGFIQELMRDGVDPYEVKRKNFEYFQSKFDAALSQSQSLERDGENSSPRFLRDESAGLFDMWKHYLDASLGIVAAIAEIQLHLDRFLVQVTSQINAQNKFSLSNAEKEINLVPELDDYVSDYTSWINITSKTAGPMQDGLKQSQRYIYHQAMKEFEPSQDLAEYNLDKMNFAGSSTDCFAHVRQKKAGWLYMKSFVGSDNKEVWVRRWCFVDDLIFGMFLLSPAKTSVEETDKFGMGLIRAKYLPEVPQRFAFQLTIKGAGADKKSDLELVFQAENVESLKSWIQIFQKAKSKYLTLLEDNKVDVSYAAKRYPPRFLEFASSLTTVNDQLLTTYDSKATISLIEKVKKDFKTDSIDSLMEQKSFGFLLASTPLSTKLTPLALLSGVQRNKYEFYDAIQANIWGVNTINQNGGVSIKIGESNKRLKVADVYPSNYPDSLKALNIQFKTIFESINYEYAEGILQSIDELLLFRFSAIWAANRTQRIAAMFYVTEKYIYVYMSFLGFSHLSRRPIDSYSSVEYDTGVRNVIKLHTLDGLHLKFHVFFANYKMVASKLQYLIEARQGKTKKTTEEIITKFQEIAEVYQEQEGSDRKAFFNKESEIANTLGKTFWNINTSSKKLMDRCKNIRKNYTRTYTKCYPISSKGLMHILFGDQSKVFPDSLFFADRNSNYNTNWYWKKVEISKGTYQLVRSIQFNLNRTDNFLSDNAQELSTNQRIIRMIENRYYEVDQDPLVMKIPFCHPLKIAAKYVITEPADPESSANSKLHLSSNESVFHTNYKIEYLETKTPTFVETVVKNFIERLTYMEFNMIWRAVHYYLERIGTHSKTVKAMKLGGLIGVISNTEDAEKEPTEKDEDNETSGEPLEEWNSETRESDTNSEKMAAELSKDMEVSAAKDMEANMNQRATYDVTYSVSLLLKVLAKLIVSRIVRTFFIVLRLLIVGLSFVGTALSHINKTLLLGLLVSIIFNLFFSGRSTMNYWSVKKANSIFNDFVAGNQKSTMERALYIKDMDLLTDYLSNSDSNAAFKKFNEELSTSRGNQYGESRRQVAVRRNELLVELRILQNMEKEILHGDYRKFLIQEIEKCRKVHAEYPKVWVEDPVLKKYCDSCNEELQNLSSKLL
ncbi:uncharacterized protein KNAG_0K02490 [Huiozyma naganishii CBS 8797]|uniref:PH domain-containing protein n=1 Tax=Huiozyma naganishii (strain ATCC MYA-139 / BCRC 22969 / CBS 8797 / KCTC 17520 / NBRC 10181 / NCYC 3082 / Yp74L-3) TaxID=1071383 RepID=J7S3G8_HUIN7|nr:hypothetical protein KNAG_0K02490 [Kazachstania naganishii CBS 8797]CCK72612.1 hypothetical protein KNAG_0K02490 [Kazachstania naganishii CBS 8797]